MSHVPTMLKSDRLVFEKCFPAAPNRILLDQSFQFELSEVRVTGNWSVNKNNQNVIFNMCKKIHHSYI